MINVKLQCVPDHRLLEIMERRYGDEDGLLPTKSVRAITEVKGTLSREIQHFGNKILVVFAPTDYHQKTNMSEPAVSYRENRAIMEASTNIQWQAHYRVGGCLMDIYEYNK